MPSFADLKLAMGGLWLLIKGDARGLSAFDISDRGVLYSFWTFILALPADIILGLDQRQQYLAAFPDTHETTVSFLAKCALIWVSDWLLPLAAFFVILSLAKRQALFRTFVVVFNWGNLAALYMTLPILLLMIVIPEPLDDWWWWARLYGFGALLIGCIAFVLISAWQIAGVVAGRGIFLRLSVIASFCLPAMLMFPIEKQLGIYIP